MSKLRFTDGVEFNLAGRLRIEEKFDGFYVVGQGRLIPVKDRKEGQEIIDQLNAKKKDNE